MRYFIEKLNNHLNLMVVPIKNAPSVTLTVWVKTGSRNEDLKLNGISHFLEHMMFKGTKKRPNAKIISQEIDAMGAVNNASTSKEWTNYYIKCRSSQIEQSFDILSDMLLGSLIDSSEIEREKGTIIEEIKMYEDAPMMKIGDVFEQLIYKGSSLERDIAGTRKTVSELKRNDFLDYKAKHYFASNILVSVVGGVTKENAIKLAEKYFYNVKDGKKPPRVSDYNFSYTKKTPSILLDGQEKSQAHIMLGFLADGKGYEHKIAQSLLATLLGSGMSSRLFIEVRERRGLAYAVRTSMDRYTDTGFLGTYAGLETKKAAEAIKIMVDEHLKIKNKQKPIEKEELTKAKEYLKGHLSLSLEDTSDVSSFFADQFISEQKEILTPDELFKKIDAVTIDDLYTQAQRIFVPERLNLAIIGPFKSKSEFEPAVLF